MRLHRFQPDPTATNWRGEPTCSACPLPDGHAVHRVPPVAEEATEIDARVLGEREEEQ